MYRLNPPQQVFGYVVRKIARSQGHPPSSVVYSPLYVWAKCIEQFVCG